MKKKLKILALMAMAVMVFTACSSEEAPMEEQSSGDTSESASSAVEDSDEPTQEELDALVEQMNEEIKALYYGTTIPEDAIEAVMSTSMGDITLRLFPSEAPMAVENFTTHAKNGYYDGVTFHRVINDFMIQGGDPSGNGTGGESIWGGGFETEYLGKLHHFYGAISMANTGQPKSNGSQFFIVEAKSTDEAIISQALTGGWPQGAVDVYEDVNGTIFLDGRHPVFGYVIEGMDIVEAISAVEVDSDDKPLESVIINSITIR